MKLQSGNVDPNGDIVDSGSIVWVATRRAAADESFDFMAALRARLKSAICAESPIDVAAHLTAIAADVDRQHRAARA